MARTPITIAQLIANRLATALAGTEGWHGRQGAGSVGITAQLVKDFTLSGLAGTSVGHTPDGNIIATNVSAAIAELDSEKVAKAGDTMTGSLTLSGSPVNTGHATTKGYVDAADDTKLIRTGDTGVGIYSFLGSAHTPQTPASGTTFIVSDSGGVTRVLYDNYNTGAGGPTVTFRKARGTAAAPSRLSASDQIMNIGGFGFGTTVYSINSRVGITARATELWTDTAHGTSISFNVTPATTATTVTGLLLTSAVMDLVSTASFQMGGVDVITSARNLIHRSYTVGTLPTAGIVGRTCWASNCRAFNGAGVQEGAGLGTGSLVTDNGAAWKIAGTNVTAVA
jgi:hypothetical protein